MAVKPTYEELEKSVHKLAQAEVKQKRAEERLKKERETLSTILDSNPHGIAMIDNNDQYRYINPCFTKITGYTLKDIPSKKEWFEKAYPKADYRKKAADTWEKDNLIPDIEKNQEFTITCKKGESKHIEFRSTFLKDQTICVLTDVTKSRKAEEALRESEEKLKAIFEANPDPVAVYDVNGYPLYLNLAFTEVFGWSLNELRGRRIPFVPKDQENLAKSKIKEIFKSGNPVRFETKRLSKQGRTVYVLLSAAILKDRQGINNGLVVNLNDITERKKLEIQLQQAQKMEAIGTLAGGIAHDFNNILFPVLGHTEILMMDTPKDSPAYDRLKKLYAGAIRARDLVKQILTFSRQDSFELKTIQLQPIVKEVLDFIRATIPTTIEIRQDISNNCTNVKADSTQIHQIVMNLTTNAYHAMEETGGELKVSLKEIEFGRHDIISPDMKSGTYVCLSVADTGIGMDKELTGKIFDPFFTTKEKGKGTGMGLSVVHGIVAGMNGIIQADSKPDKGTKINVYFPVEKKDSERLPDQAKNPMPGGIEKILLVDDEEDIVTMEKQTLELLGYQVTSHTSSIEALENFQADPHKFDMVITDMAMPKMPGDKLSTELISIRPDIPILLCTGFSETISEEKAASMGIKGFLLKPIGMKDLSRKIREVLDN